MLIVTSLASKDDGYMPSGTGSSTSMTRVGGKSCGRCHGGTASITGMTIRVQPSARVLNGGQTISIKVDAENPRVPSNTGGFAADISSGKLVASSTTRTRGDGLAITHRNDRYRSWTFNYKAPTTPGLVEFYYVGMASDGDGRGDPGDKYGFFGADPSSLISTPVRFYVNAPFVTSVGESCTDGYGNHSVLGSPTTPRVGGPLRLEAYGLPPMSRALLMLGIGKATPGFDMAPMGAAGCVLRTTLALQLVLQTTGGRAAFAEGRLILPGALPNDPNLKGATLSVQVGAIDNNSKRAFPMLVTNTIELKVQ